jgi:UBX domain-containing protein 1
MAVGSFFEGGGANDEEVIEQNFAPPGRNLNTKSRHHEDDGDDDDDDDEDFSPFSRNQSNNPFAGLSRPTQAAPKPKTRSSDKPRIATLRDDNTDEEDDEERGQAFYAGGSEQSGQQILGPNRQNPEDLIKGLFQKAKE